jgi:hypothetical protein
MLSYSLLILICLVVSTLVGLLYNVKIKADKLTLYTFIVSFMLMLGFNTYLTALPIVVYNMNSILNIRIITFPIEDIGYLVAVVLLLPALYNKLCDEQRRDKKPSKS